MKQLIILISTCLLLLPNCTKHQDLTPEFVTRQINEQQAELINIFSTLTNNNTSACNLIFETSEITDVLCRLLIDAEPGSEVVFMVDHTTSMIEEIDEVKININEIIDCLPDGVVLGVSSYGDVADGEEWFDFLQLTLDRQPVRDFVNDIYLRGGGRDYPESVYDAIYKTLEIMDWADCSAPDRIIVMGDAPPLEDRTTYNADDVLSKAMSICPDTKFYPVIILDL